MPFEKPPTVAHSRDARMWQPYVDITPGVFDALAAAYGLQYIARMAEVLPDPEPEPEPEPEPNQTNETINETTNSSRCGNGSNQSNATNRSGCNQTEVNFCIAGEDGVDVTKCSTCNASVVPYCGQARLNL